MKIRIASSIALAAALALGATGCSLIAPHGTLVQYAPSDGIDANVGGVDVRNLMLVADETGENFNVVFTGVNQGNAPVDLRIAFMDKGSEVAAADFTLEPGSTSFGNPDGDEEPVLVTVPGLKAGALVTVYLQVSGADEVERQVPVLDGTLPEYEAYVLPAPSLIAVEEGSTGTKAGDTPADAEKPAGESSTEAAH